MQGTQEHDDMARAIASVVGKRKKRPGLELGWNREGGDTVAAFPHPQEAPLVPGSPPLPWPPKIPSLLFCLWLQWLLLMLPLASPWTDTPVGCLGFNHPTLLKYPSAFPASALLNTTFSLLWDRIFFPLLSPPYPWEKTTTKKKAPTPQEGAADSRGGDRRRRAQDLLGKGSQIPGRKGKGLKVRAVAAAVLCHPCSLSRGLQHNSGDRCL